MSRRPADRTTHLTLSLSPLKGGEGTKSRTGHERPAIEGKQRSAPGGLKVGNVNGTGPRSGPAGATAPARRKARSQASGASARRLRENKES